MRMKMPFGVIRSVKWGLMESHRVRERHVEDAIISGDDLFQDRTELSDFGFVQFGECPQVTAAAEQNFKWPYGPEGHERYEGIIAENDAEALDVFERNVVAQQGRMAGIKITVLAC